jgi:hypothetical protein
VRCLSCKYDLSNLTPTEGVHRCPECGRAFDPNDSDTFDHGQTFHGLRVTLRAAVRLAAFYIGTYATIWVLAIVFHVGSQNEVFFLSVFITITISLPFVLVLWAREVDQPPSK